MFQSYKKSMVDKKNRTGIFILLVFSLFIMGSQSIMAAQGAATNLGINDGEILQNCLLDGGKKTTLPNGAEECCVGRYCTSCLDGECSTTCNYRKQGLSNPGPGCTIIPTLREHGDTNPIAPGVMAPTNPPILPPGTPPGTPPTFPIPPHKPPTIPLVAPAASGQSAPSTPGILVAPVMGKSTNVTRATAPADSNTTNGFNNCGMVTAGFWECYKDGKKYYCTGKGKGCVIKRATTKPPIIEKSNTSTRVYAPATTTKPLEESPQEGYTPIGSPETLHRMK